MLSAVGLTSAEPYKLIMYSTTVQTELSGF